MQGINDEDVISKLVYGLKEYDEAYGALSAYIIEVILIELAKFCRVSGIYLILKEMTSKWEML